MDALSRVSAWWRHRPTGGETLDAVDIFIIRNHLQGLLQRDVLDMEADEIVTLDWEMLGVSNAALRR